MSKDDNKINELSFEQAIVQLKEIVEKIEVGDIALQQSIEQYEKGIELIEYCRGKLKKAEKKIEQLTSSEEAANND